MPKISFAAHISGARGYRTLNQETPTSGSAAITGATHPSPTTGWQRADARKVRRNQMGSYPVPRRGRHPRQPEACA